LAKKTAKINAGSVDALIKLFGSCDENINMIKDKLDVEVSLSRMQLTRLGNADDYDVSITGVADVDINDRAYLDRFPFGLDGKVSVGFKPFRLHTDSYAVRLGNTDGKVDVNIELENGPRINRFNYSMNYFDLNGLLALLPRAQIPFLQGLDADLSIRGDAQITTPYMLDSDRLPSGTLSGVDSRRVAQLGQSALRRLQHPRRVAEVPSGL